MSKTAAGRAGERLFQAVVALSSRFDLNAGEPGGAMVTAVGRPVP